MTTIEKKKKTITLLISREKYEKLVRIAESERRSVNQIANFAFDFYFEQGFKIGSVKND